MRSWLCQLSRSAATGSERRPNSMARRAKHPQRSVSESPGLLSVSGSNEAPGRGLLVSFRSPRGGEELGAEDVTHPALVLFAGPATRGDEKVPHVGVVQGPKDVGRACDVE